MTLPTTSTYTKDPDEERDFGIDWAKPLAGLGSDTITASTWTVPDGIEKTDEAHTATTTTVWLDGGTVGEVYEVLNRVVTAGGRTLDHTLRFHIRGS